MRHILGFSSLDMLILVVVLRSGRYFEHSDVCLGAYFQFFVFLGWVEPPPLVYVLRVGIPYSTRKLYIYLVISVMFLWVSTQKCFWWVPEGKTRTFWYKVFWSIKNVLLFLWTFHFSALLGSSHYFFGVCVSFYI